jgi:competence protein ComEC
VRFEVLHPLAIDYDSPAPSNAMSCVLRVVAASGASALLTGDMEAVQEAAVLARAAAAAHPLRSDFLLAPHHGSRTSSTAAFLDAVSPRVAVFQAAYRSRYGHPAPDVLARYVERGISIVRSDECGAAVWRSRAEAKDETKAEVRAETLCQRDLARRYWHFRAQP